MKGERVEGAEGTGTSRTRRTNRGESAGRKKLSEVRGAQRWD